MLCVTKSFGLSSVRGRLAPSPTGHLHLGNAWAFLLSWLAARHERGEILLRIEDIDSQRSRSQFVDGILEDLQWLGLDWDFIPETKKTTLECSLSGFYLQSRRSDLYAEALAQLEQENWLYPCFCSRSALRNIATAPHIDDVGIVYPGTCRNLTSAQRKKLLAQGRQPSLRLRCPEGVIHFNDAVQGTQCLTLEACGGDFVLRRSDGVVSYQLAVAVDDGHMGVTQVVRGRDILLSTPRQIVLLRLLGYSIPEYAHVPLLLDANGQRLAKRHNALSLRTLRQSGANACNVIGLLGYLAGINPFGSPATPAQLLSRFKLSCLPHEDIRVTTELLSTYGLCS